MLTSFRFRLLPALALFLAASLTHAAEIAGIHFADKATLAGTELQLNGTGLRTRFMLKVYAMGLYLPQAANTQAAVLASKGAKRLQLVTLRELTAEQLADALVDGLKNNHGKTEVDKLAGRIEILRGIMLSIGKVPEKTTIRLDYLPASGTRVLVGNDARGAVISGEDFYQGLLRIWLGEHPVQNDLRNSLLGKN